MRIKTKLGKLTPEQKRLLDDAWLGVALDESKLPTVLEVPEAFKETPFLWYTYMFSHPDYLYLTCKYILNVEPAPFQLAILKEMWNRKFPMVIGSRGLGKSFLLAVYAMLRMVLMPGRKVVVAGAGFRQSRLIFEYMDNIWRNAPMLRHIFKGAENGPKRDIDECRFILGRSILKAIPVGTGEKIRGIRAHDLLVDEFSSLNRDIFETVLAGFGAVTANPLENVKIRAALKLARSWGLEVLEESEKEKGFKSNQLIITGTASFDFEHFADYWKRWRQIILSRGNNKLISNFEVDEKNFHWEDYSIIRIPYEKIPEGFMDDATVARAKATNHISTYMREYGAVFPKDSMGFFKRSLIEQCTVKDGMNESHFPEGAEVFYGSLTGDKTKKYVMGIDPASDVDNFSIIIMEVNKTHRRIVYCWTTNKKDHIERLQYNLTQENNYYAFCARKIRSLYDKFNVDLIAIDSQGGGKQIVDAMNDKDKMNEGEDFLWPVIDEKKEQYTDNLAGKHIIHLVNFAKAEWTNEANHGLKKDLEDKAILFPFFDSVFLAGITAQDKDGNKLYDTLEDCMFEIEELKNELCLIVHTKTASGRDHWDTPETKTSTGRKGRLRKDRYSALIMANYYARNVFVTEFQSKSMTSPIMGFAGFGDYLIDDSQGLYLNKPDWFNADYDIV